MRPRPCDPLSVNVAIRIFVALAFILPAGIRGWMTPWWHTLGITFVAFVIAEGVARWLRGAPSRRRDRVVLGLAILATIGTTAAAALSIGRSPSDDGILHYRELGTVVAGDEEGEVRVHGIVQSGSVALAPGTQAYEFVLEQGGTHVRVRARGIPSETFREDGEAIVEGSLRQENGERILDARRVLTLPPRF